MPLLQKIVKVGTSRGVVLPHAWLACLERQGVPVTEVLLEVNGDIKIRPVYGRDR